MAQASILLLRDLERRRGQLQRLNRLLLAGLPLLALGLAWDLFHWAGELRRPVELVPPRLEGLREAPPEVPTLELAESLFSLLKPSTQKPDAPPAALRPPWKLKGVSMGGVPRAFVEKEDGSEKMWITEGQQVGAHRVQKINERSVVVESEGAVYEISM